MGCVKSPVTGPVQGQHALVTASLKDSGLKQESSKMFKNPIKKKQQGYLELRHRLHISSLFKLRGLNGFFLLLMLPSRHIKVYLGSGICMDYTNVYV